MAELTDILDNGEVDPNVTGAVKREGGLEISDTTGLQEALDGKAEALHGHLVSDISDWPSTFPPSAHTHTTSEISDFPTEMPPTSHGHEIAEINGLQDALDAKEDSLGAPADNNQVKLYQADGTTGYVDLPVGGSNPVWGDIGGTLSNQTDLQAALDAKQNDLSVGTIGQFLGTVDDGSGNPVVSWTDVPAGGTVEWGDIQGDITAQTDLMAELDLKLEDAPSDGNQYARQDGAWAVVTGGDGGIPDAPSDGTLYGRQDATWVNAAPATHTHTTGEISDWPATFPPETHGHAISDVTDLQTELDAKLETVPNATDTVVGGIKVRLDSANSTVYITTDGSTP